jgi:RsiW-degrading membrane proteinase PrsW (M82 family)
MDRLASFFSALVPGLMVLAYGIAKTRSNWANEALWTAFFVGGVGAIAAIPLEFALDALLGVLALAPLMKSGLTAVFIAAIPEETIKFVILIGAAERHVDARRRQDIIALAIAVSLGFATIENLFYVVVPQDWRFIAVGRALTAVPGHGIDGLAMGALLIAARLRPEQQHRRIFLACAVPIVMHAAYDFPLFALKYAHPTGGVSFWLIILWLATLLTTAAVAIVLCNRILPAAAAADRLSRRDPRSQAPAAPLVIAGCALLIASPILAVGLFSMKGLPYPRLGAAMAILPAALAVDLIWSGIQRRKIR